MFTLLIAHLAITWALVGLIWTIQLVHYPLFAHSGAEAFRSYHEHHTKRITWLVGPLMVAEVISAGLLLGWGLKSTAFLIGLPSLGIVWASTVVIQVPLHQRLAKGFDGETIKTLVRSNWIRTLAWTLRGGTLVWVVVEHASRPDY